MICLDCIFYDMCSGSDITGMADNCGNYEEFEFDDVVVSLSENYWPEMSYNQFLDNSWDYLEDDEDDWDFYDDDELDY